MKRLLTLLTFLILIIISLFAATPAVYAVEGKNWVDNDYMTCIKSAIKDGEVCGGAYGDMLQGAAMAGVTRRILGPVPGITIAYNETDREYIQQLARGSAVGGMQNYIAMLYANPPAQLKTWVADTGQSLGFIPRQAYAQGIGFSGLSLLLPLWKAFRNIAYLILAVIMIVIGFMIMFRKKIDPKTVVTVQNSLPRIVITLILITFSYAIVGAMIDLMYLTILLTVGIFKSTGLLPNPSWISQQFGLSTPEALYTQGSTLHNIWNLFGPIDLQFGNIAIAKSGLLNTTELANLVIFGDSAGAFSIGTTVAAVGGLLIAIPSAGIGLPIAGLAAAPLIIGLLLGLGILFLIIRLFIFFLSNYIQVILALLFAPLQILMEAIPGTNSFASWFGNLLANIVVFPIGAAVFMLSAVFGKFALEGNGAIWSAPYVPLFNASARGVAALLSLGVLFAIPSIAGSIKEALKPKPFINAGPEAVVGIFGQPVTIGMQMLQFWHTFQTTQLLKSQLGGGKGGGGHGKP